MGTSADEEYMYYSSEGEMENEMDSFGRETKKNKY